MSCYYYIAVGVTQCWIWLTIQNPRGAIPRTSTALGLIHSALDIFRLLTILKNKVVSQMHCVWIRLGPVAIRVFGFLNSALTSGAPKKIPPTKTTAAKTGKNLVILGLLVIHNIVLTTF
jgi:hypothetical protein